MTQQSRWRRLGRLALHLIWLLPLSTCSLATWRYIAMMTETVVAARVASPDGRAAAIVKDEFGWGYATSYLLVGRRQGPRVPLGEDRLVQSDDGGLILRWRSNRDLDVGYPIHVRPRFLRSEKDGIRIRLVPYPQAAATLAGTSADRVSVGGATYTLSRAIDRFGKRVCSLGFVAGGGSVAPTLRLTLNAFIGAQGPSSIDLYFGVHGVRDPLLKTLTSAGGQFIGDGFATSMAQRAWQYPEYAPESDFGIFLDHQPDLDQLLGALSHPPYRLAFLWDLPDTLVVYEVRPPPTSGQLTSFFDCVGDAKPAHDPDPDNEKP